MFCGAGNVFDGSTTRRAQRVSHRDNVRLLFLAVTTAIVILFPVTMFAQVACNPHHSPAFLSTK